MGEETVLFHPLLFIDTWVRDEKKGWKGFFLLSLDIIFFSCKIRFLQDFA